MGDIVLHITSYMAYNKRQVTNTILINMITCSDGFRVHCLTVNYNKWNEHKVALVLLKDNAKPGFKFERTKIIGFVVLWE